MKKETLLSAIIVGLILLFMVWMIDKPEPTECEVQTIYVTHRTVFYYACGLTSWDMVEWSEPTAFELRRIEKYKGK